MLDNIMHIVSWLYSNLKNYLKRPLSLSLLNHLRNEVESVANAKPIFQYFVFLVSPLSQ